MNLREKILFSLLVVLVATLGGQQAQRHLQAKRARELAQLVVELKGAEYSAEEILEDYNHAAQLSPEAMKEYWTFFLEERERQAREAAYPLYRKVGESAYYWSDQAVRCATLWPCDIHGRISSYFFSRIIEQSNRMAEQLRKEEREFLEFQNHVIAVALDELKFSEQGRRVAEFILDKSKGVSVRFVRSIEDGSDAEYVVDDRMIHLDMRLLLSYPKSTAISVVLAHEGFHAIQYARGAKRPCLGLELEASFMQYVIYHELIRARVRPVPVGHPFWNTYILFSKRMRRQDYQGQEADATAEIHGNIKVLAGDLSKTRWGADKKWVLNLNAVCPATRDHARLHEVQYAWQKRWMNEHWREFLRL